MLKRKNKNKDRKVSKSQLIIVGSLLIIVGIGITCMIFSAIHFPCFYEETGKYRYRCILEDNVSANYIADNFNIIEIKGKEWIIESRGK